MRLGGFTPKTFTDSMASVIKKVLVRVISFVTTTDEITNVHAENVTTVGSSSVTEVDVHFRLEIRLDRFVARSHGDDGRRLSTFSGNEANMTRSFSSQMSSAVSSGNMSTHLASETAKANVTGVNITLNKNATTSAGATTSTIVVEYTRPPTSVPTFVPSRSPTLVPTSSPTLLPSKVPIPAPSGNPTMKPTVAAAAPTAPTPTRSPSSRPTTADTVRVAVQLSMSASAAPTNAQKTTLKTTIASVISVDVVYIYNFAVTHTADTTRRRLLSRAARRLATTYTWSVSFDIVVPLSALSDGSISSAADLSSSVFKSLDKGLEDAVSSAGIDATVDEVATSTPNDDSTNDDDDDGSASSAGIIIGGAAGGGVLMIGLVAFAVYKIKFAKVSKDAKPSKKKKKAMEPVATADLEEDGENGEAAEVASSEVEMVETASEDRGPLTFMVKALKGTTESVPATTSISTKESNVETVAL